ARAISRAVRLADVGDNDPPSPTTSGRRSVRSGASPWSSAGRTLAGEGPDGAGRRGVPAPSGDAAGIEYAGGSLAGKESSEAWSSISSVTENSSDEAVNESSFSGEPGGSWIPR